MKSSENWVISSSRSNETRINNTWQRSWCSRLEQETPSVIPIVEAVRIGNRCHVRSIAYLRAVCHLSFVVCRCAVHHHVGVQFIIVLILHLALTKSEMRDGHVKSISASYVKRRSVSRKPSSVKSNRWSYIIIHDNPCSVMRTTALFIYIDCYDKHFYTQKTANVNLTVTAIQLKV